MTQKQVRRRELAMAGVFVLSLAMTAFLGHAVGLGRSEEMHGSAPSLNATSGHARKNIQTSAERRAQRVKERLENQTGKRFTVQSVEDALDRRAQLLSRSIEVRVHDAAAGMTAEWNLDLKQYAWLLEVKPEFGRPMFTINKNVFARALRQGSFKDSNPVTDSYVSGISRDKDVLRADTTAVARPGFDYTDESVDLILEKLLGTATGAVFVQAQYRDGDVYMEEGGRQKKLSLLSSGRSNFTNSPEAREKNVQKAINEHVNNVVVDKGGTFSFNSTLGGNVTLDKGWVEALGLFGGGTAMTPGGGICQASTTVYRAAVLAGLPIVYKRNHSLYVTYYETHGVGIDSTIFPGVHDLVFRNDSPDQILIQAYTEGEDARVNIYGIPDGRAVALDGPYFVSTRPRPSELRPLGYNDIGWVQRITYADGTQLASPIISRYAKPIPLNVARKYPTGASEDLLHAAAPQQTP